jgi:hypothetical protein
MRQPLDEEKSGLIAVFFLAQGARLFDERIGKTGNGFGHGLILSVLRGAVTSSLPGYFYGIRRACPAVFVMAYYRFWANTHKQGFNF